MVRFNRTHSFLKFTSVNFSNLCFVLWQNTSESSRIHSIHPQNDAKFAPFIYPLYIMFQMPDRWQRTLCEIPVNQVKFTPFAHKFHELREFCTKIHPHLVHYFQNHRQRTPGNWSESTRFCAVRPQLPRITRNSLNPHP